MAESAQFFLALLLVYLSECGAWVRRSTWGLRGRGVGLRVVHPAGILGHGEAGLLVGSPWPSPAGLRLVHEWPLALGSAGVVVGTRQAADPARAPASAGEVVPWSALSRLHADGSRVLRGDAELVRAGSPSAARRLVRLLAELAALPASDRDERIAQALDAGFDVEAIRRRHAEVEAELRGLTWCARALAVHTFVVAPVVSAAFGLGQVWFHLLLGFALGWSLCATLFVRAHRRLRPGRRGALVEALVLMTLLPLGAMRAPSALRRGALDAFDAVACVLALSTGDERGARRKPGLEGPGGLDAILRDLFHPAGAYGESEPARQLRDEFHEAYVARVTRLLDELELPVEVALGAPAPDRDAVAWCPRCRAQFVSVDARCDSCGDRALTAYAAAV